MIRELIEQLAGTHKINNIFIVDAEVIEINISERTCTCEIISGKKKNVLNDVRLMASVDDGLLIIPEVNSTVCIVLSDQTDPYISQYSAVEKIVLRGGDLGGLIVAEKLQEKLNKLENLVNNLLNAYNLHTHLSAAPGAPTATALPVLSDTALQITKAADLENENITHG